MRESRKGHSGIPGTPLSLILSIILIVPEGGFSKGWVVPLSDGFTVGGPAGMGSKPFERIPWQKDWLFSVLASKAALDRAVENTVVLPDRLVHYDVWHQNPKKVVPLFAGDRLRRVSKCPPEIGPDDQLFLALPESVMGDCWLESVPSCCESVIVPVDDDVEDESAVELSAAPRRLPPCSCPNVAHCIQTPEIFPHLSTGCEIRRVPRVSDTLKVGRRGAPPGIQGREKVKYDFATHEKFWLRNRDSEHATTATPEAVTAAPEAVTAAPEAVTTAPEAVTTAPEAADQGLKFKVKSANCLTFDAYNQQMIKNIKLAKQRIAELGAGDDSYLPRVALDKVDRLKVTPAECLVMVGQAGLQMGPVLESTENLADAFWQKIKRCLAVPSLEPSDRVSLSGKCKDYEFVDRSADQRKVGAEHCESVAKVSESVAEPVAEPVSQLVAEHSEPWGLEAFVREMERIEVGIPQEVFEGYHADVEVAEDALEWA
ncbi:hypothetical protein GNI_014670 [Gregarina niphandrodes]|uniref:Transmembrane protein n=1 Tax=Gregarina niphandrodes TaxID=110365 RepID=A0A023BCJ7_GRENI|nr:hypothetical protein GNI_014670 [Gregarina niphandrodes]EZG83577.1 hypothetical protein GNI_014670 [Gregarina niphandrodes]|eukprot:XP_011128938.1 hypothetical protein GNI_014670 [Gregarina niphandrodes]